MSFQRRLGNGQVGESVIANWFKQRGSSVLPAYKVEYHTGKGPQFFTRDGNFVAPDMMVFPSMVWIEAKHKTVFTWHRGTSEWCTGIDFRHYEQYQEVEEISRRPVWLMFLHSQKRPSDGDLAHGCPPECPTGLFGGALDTLKQNVHHYHANHGKEGMVYWTPTFLKQFASLAELDYLQCRKVS